MAAAKSTEPESGFDRTVDRVRDSVKSFGESAADGVADLADQSAKGVKSVAHAVPNVSHWIDDKADAARDRVRAEPLKMMAIAVGAGALLGALFLRR